MVTDREILIMYHGADIHFIAPDGARWVFKDRQTPKGGRIQRSFVGAGADLGNSLDSREGREERSLHGVV